MTQLLIDTKAVKNALAAVDKFCLKVQTGQAKSVETYHDLMLVGNDLRAALANAERVEPEPTRIERKVYKNSAEHSDYLSARFTKDKQAGSFEWQGHRWAYHWTSFDDEGDFDLIYRNTTPKDMP